MDPLYHSRRPACWGACRRSIASVRGWDRERSAIQPKRAGCQGRPTTDRRQKAHESSRVRYNHVVAELDEKTVAHLKELRQVLGEIDRFSSRARELLDEIEGKRDKEMEEFARSIVAELRARSRAKELGLPPPPRVRRKRPGV